MEEIFILVGEDDADDRFLLKSAFEENGYTDELFFVENGVELLEYLYKATTNANEVKIPRFILLDLNMPKKDGREVLKELKQDPKLKKIPVIIFSTTNSEHEMKRCYELGANSYITKPNSFENLIKTVAALRSYWIHTTTIPLWYGISGIVFAASIILGHSEKQNTGTFFLLRAKTAIANEMHQVCTVEWN